MHVTLENHCLEVCLVLGSSLLFWCLYHSMWVMFKFGGVTGGRVRGGRDGSERPCLACLTPEEG